VSGVITVVGHADLSASTLDLLAGELPVVLAEAAAAGAVGVVRAAAGLPVVFGRAVCRSGMALLVVLPGTARSPEPLPESDRVAAGELLFLAHHVRFLSYDAADPSACDAADERLVQSSRLVMAVWDGSLSAGDPAGRLVAFARVRGIGVEAVWPPGATRTGPSSRPAASRSPRWQ
jgi:hypothetical protein